MNFDFEKKLLSEGYRFVIGCDEVGRGSLAGPVVAAAVVFDLALFLKNPLPEIFFQVNDSKVVSPELRCEINEVMQEYFFDSGIGSVSHRLIDEHNIHHASLCAMRQAVGKVVTKFLGFGIPRETDKRVLDEERVVACEAFEGVKNFSNPIDVKYERELRFSSSPKLWNSRKDFVSHEALVLVDGKYEIPKLRLLQQAVVDGDAKIFSIAVASIVAKVFRDRFMEKLHSDFPEYNFLQHKGYGTKEHVARIRKHGLSRVHRKSFCGKIVG